MTWALILPLLLQYGPEFAAKIWALFNSNAAPTQKDWDDLLALTKQNAKAQMALALARNGIDPNSDMGKALLALAG